jgi:hypothetical protein
MNSRRLVRISGLIYTNVYRPAGKPDRAYVLKGSTAVDALTGWPAIGLREPAQIALERIEINFTVESEWLGWVDNGHSQFLASSLARCE